MSLRYRLILVTAVTLVVTPSHANSVSDAIDRQTQALQQMELDRQFNEQQREFQRESDQQIINDQKLICGVKCW